MTAERTVWRSPDEAESIALLGGLYRYRAVGADNDGTYSLFEVTGPAGFASPFHIHGHETEAFYVESGQVTLFLGDAERLGGPGSFGFVPARITHTFRFDSPDVRLLLLVTPGNEGHEALFREMGQPADSPDSAAAPGPPDFGKLAEIAARHGTTIVGPPPGPSAG